MQSKKDIFYSFTRGTGNYFHPRVIIGHYLRSVVQFQVNHPKSKLISKLALRGPYVPLTWFTSNYKSRIILLLLQRWNENWETWCHSSSLAGCRWVCPPRTAWTGRRPPTTLNQLWPITTIIISTQVSMEIVRYQNFIVQLLTLRRSQSLTVIC